MKWYFQIVISCTPTIWLPASFSYLSLLDECKCRGPSAEEAAALQASLSSFVELISIESSWQLVDLLLLNAKYMNMLTSVLLAKRVKEKWSNVRTLIFGELIFDVEQADEYSAIFPFIDSFCFGADFSKIITNIAALFKDGRSENSINPVTDGYFLPDYDDYFAEVPESIEPTLIIETSRGCWWYKCHFCSSRGADRKVYQKSGEQVSAEIRELTAKYKVLKIELSDICLNPKIVGSPLLNIGSVYDFQIFAEVKSDLSVEEMDALYNAGIRVVQVGIESFSTRVLEDIEKGVSCLDNILFLRRAAEIGIEVNWNMMYGFQCETSEDYSFAVQLIPSLVHLAPPSNLVKLRGERGSYYHLSGFCSEPKKVYDLIFPSVTRASIRRLANYFDVPINPNIDGLNDLRAALMKWAEAASAASLTLERGPGFLLIRDARGGGVTKLHVLTKWKAMLYLFCREIRKIGQVLQFASEELGVDIAAANNFLEYLQTARLVAIDRDEILALATSCLRMQGDRDASEASDRINSAG
jgi:hypothetical protein